MGHLPGRLFGTRESDRIRQEQQEQNQPPEKTATGGESNEGEEELPEEKIKAAQKRLGREVKAWDSG